MGHNRGCTVRRSVSLHLERCESGRIGLTANQLRSGPSHEVADSPRPHQARSDQLG